MPEVFFIISVIILVRSIAKLHTLPESEHDQRYKYKLMLIAAITALVLCIAFYSVIALFICGGQKK